uniref:Uncharacterized protein n=1 Tax=Setaria digitata TaxID=48799 RepID=A0A915PH37_9BILA
MPRSGRNGNTFTAHLSLETPISPLQLVPPPYPSRHFSVLFVQIYRNKPHSRQRSPKARWPSGLRRWF